MHLDHTFIAIRERKFLEICDLALHVIRDHFKPLSILFLVGVMPWILFDSWVTQLLLMNSSIDQFGAVYGWIMILLVASQAQLGTLFITAYLGQAMFMGRPSLWKTISSTLRSLCSPYVLWKLLGTRLTIITAGLALFLLIDDEDVWLGSAFFWIPVSVGIGLLVRALRPFASEMFLLEQTPASSSSPTVISYAQRSKSLHAQAGSELFGRFMTMGMLVGPLAFSSWATLVLIDVALNLQSNSEINLYAYYWILALWLVAGFAAVVKFLSYIDIRIRQEGWSVELKMRAEGQRLAQTIE